MLYEMATGKRTFRRQDPDQASPGRFLEDPRLRSASFSRRPRRDSSDGHPHLPEKDPDERVQCAHDLKLQLQGIAAGGSPGGATAAASSHSKKSSTVLTAATLAGWLIAATLGILLVIYAGRLTSAHQPVHTSIEPPAGFDFFSVTDGAPALSPDGQQLAFLVGKKGTSFTPGGGSLYLLQALHRRVGARGRCSVRDVSLLVARWQISRLFL